MTAQSDSSTISVLRPLPQAASIVAIMVGSLVLLGWAFDIEILKSLFPGIVTMKANAAIAFLLAGVSLWLLRTERASVRARRIAQACAVSVAAIGLLTFSQYVFGWNLGIDELLFRDSPTAVGTSHPGRMSPNSSLNFLLVGLSLLLLDVETRRGYRPAQFLILAVALISLLALIGYAYGAESFYGIETYTRMALHAALAFLILCAGLLCARPKRGLMKTFTSKSVGGLTARRLLLVSFVVPPVLGWLGMIGLRARIYDTAFETALFVMANVIVLVILVWLNAQSLDRIEAERNRAGEALREGEERYRIVAETASDAIITIDEESEILFVNPAAGKIFGYALEEMHGQQLTMLMPEYLRHLHRAGIERYLETGQKHIAWEAVELPGLHKSGKEISLELSFGEFVRNGKRFFTGIVRDISERKRAEAELQASEQRYRYLADAMPQIVWTARPDGYFDYYNRRWFEYTGMTWEQTKGWGWQPVLHPEDVEQYLRSWATAVQTGEAFEIEYRIRRARDKTYRWHLGRGVPMHDGSGEIIKWFGTATDIDERKRAEESPRFMAEASQMLASSLDYETTLANVARLAVPQLADWCVVHMVGEGGKTLQLAAAHTDETKLELLRELNDRYPSGLDAAHSYPLVVRTGQPELIPEITDSLLADVSRDEEHLELLRHLGLKSTLCVPLTARGRTLGAITFATAESGRIYNSSDLALAEDLAHRAATAVDNARLYQEAQRANLAKDEFLATLSHELRTPLTPIIGWMHMLRSGMMKDYDLDYGLAVVEKNSQSLTRLINDLLDMSAILSGKMRIDNLPVQLDAALEEAVETIYPQAEASNINLEATFCEDGQVLVKGDRTRLVQAFWNILANAVKFSDNGSRVRVVCEADEWEARVIVEDEGQGITPEFLPFVFERFRQADSSKTRAHGGLGIGLALVKSFVEAHGGTVTAESAGPGRGSRFTIRLPRIILPIEGKAPDARSLEAAQPALDGISVLVVEDAPDTLEMLHKTLTARGYSVTQCESAAEALRAVENAAFDIIISDIGMPEIDGYELIRRLRGLPNLSNVPAIALSGYAEQRDMASSLAAGFDAHIAKPIDPADLAAQMERLLRKTDDGR